jgi:hypothetical protein
MKTVQIAISSFQTTWVGSLSMSGRGKEGKKERKAGHAYIMSI